MTANEKAATFIGWKREYCTENPRPRGSILNSKGPIRRCRHGHLTRHYSKAPDMSKPENYMQALETLRRKGYAWTLGGDPDWMDEAVGHPRKKFSGAIWGYGYAQLAKEAYGDSPVTTLAALYDTETGK